MLESNGRQWRLPCRYCWKKSPQYFQVWNLWQHHDNILPTNPCIRINSALFKKIIIICTIFLQSTQPIESIVKIASIVKTAWTASKYMHQLENHVQIPATPHYLNNHHEHDVLTCSAVGVVWSLTCPSHIQLILELCRCPFCLFEGF